MHRLAISKYSQALKRSSLLSWHQRLCSCPLAWLMMSMRHPTKIRGHNLYTFQTRVTVECIWHCCKKGQRAVRICETVGWVKMPGPENPKLPKPYNYNICFFWQSHPNEARKWMDCQTKVSHCIFYFLEKYRAHYIAAFRLFKQCIARTCFSVLFLQHFLDPDDGIKWF